MVAINYIMCYINNVSVKWKEKQMNTFYYFEGNIYETEQTVIAATKDYTNKKYDEIRTSKSFEEFETAYEEAIEEGNSSLDAIEWAK